MLSGNRSKHEDAQIITVTDKCLVRAPRPTWRRARLASERRGIAVREEGQRAKLRLQRRLVDSNVTPELCRWPGVIRDQHEENVIRIHGIRSAKSGLLGSTVQGDACVFRERSSGNSLNSRQKRKDVQRSVAATVMLSITLDNVIQRWSYLPMHSGIALPDGLDSTMIAWVAVLPTFSPMWVCAGDQMTSPALNARLIFLPSDK